MTATVPTDTDGQARADLVQVTIDDTTVRVPAGTLLIRAAELIGTQIPRFCDHPLLEPVGACRQCLVEVEGQRKPVASCTQAVTDGMVARTQLSSPAAEQAQRGVMELLLINHPLDCPVCDKGGECPLQNQAMSTGRVESRFEGAKRTYPKPIPLSSAVLLDRERCVLCARCTRFSEQIAGDRFIDLLDRGALQQVGIAEGEPLESYFSGNTVQICPVGALTGTSYRFRARPFDLVSSPNVCEHCASGCAQRTDHRRGKILRRLAGDDPEVNEEWNCDKGRWAFAYSTERDRITTPLVRNHEGALTPSSWPEALAVAARGLSRAIGNTGVLTGGRLTREDSYAYSKFARVVLGTNDIDCRARVHSPEEADFLAARVAGAPVTVSYSQLEQAPVVLLAGFEPEEESPMVYLRLRKAARTRGVPIFSLAAYPSRGVARLSGTVLPTIPGTEPAFLAAMSALARGETTPLTEVTALARVSGLLSQPGAVILAGERLAGIPGALSAVAQLADTTGADLAWVPRRAGERGAISAGALPGLLPGGRPLTDPDAREQVQRVWQPAELPSTPGRDTAAMLADAHTLGALLIGGVELDDLPDPDAAHAALETAEFVISLELRHSAVTDQADVVFPVAAAPEKAGSYLTWEGRPRPFEAALTAATGRRGAAPLSDQQVLSALATAMRRPLGLPDQAAVHAELAELGSWSGPPVTMPGYPHQQLTPPEAGRALLASWRMLLDDGRLQDGEPQLAGTAPTPVVRLSPRTAAEIGATEGAPVTVSTSRGSITAPLALAQLPDRVVWLPLRSPGCSVHATLGVTAGAVVDIRPESVGAAAPSTEGNPPHE